MADLLYMYGDVEGVQDLVHDPSRPNKSLQCNGCCLKPESSVKARAGYPDGSRRQEDCITELNVRVYDWIALLQASSVQLCFATGFSTWLVGTSPLTTKMLT